MSAYPDDGLFDRARAIVTCDDVAGRRVTLRKGRGICPLNGCGTNSKAQPFAILNQGRTWKCWSCDPRGGDVCDLEHKLFSTGADTLADAARRLVGGEIRQESAESSARRAQERARAEADAMRSAAWKAALAEKLWRESVPAMGTLAQTYLESRGIVGPVAARALGMLRFNPRAYHSGHPELGVFLPAMVGLITTEFGATGGVHVTYLAPDGRAKTHRKPAKRMWGPQAALVGEGEDAVAYPGGIWLTRPDAAGPLVVAEGIENALSRAILIGGDLCLAVRAAAAGSLDRLSGFEVTDPATGARDVFAVKGDPMRPSFTWPEDPAAPWGEVEIATDGDMSEVRVKGLAGKKKNRVVEFVRHPSERARVCGTLAIAAWRRRLAPDSATTVKASRSPAGVDFNDVLLSTARGQKAPPSRCDASGAPQSAGTEAAA